MNEQGREEKDTAQLADVLTFLCTQTRTGRLVIGAQEREGEVFITDGKITHAQFEQCTGLQALFFMLAWEKATYNFTPKHTTDQTTIEMETAEMLPLLAQRMQEWNQINNEHPLNLNAALCLLPEARGTIRLKKEEWDIVARIDGRKSLREIADELFMAPLDLVKAIQRFREAGLIGEGTRYPATAYAALGEEFLSALERELDLIVGPIAPMLLEDALKDLEETPEPLTTDKIEILLERLSNTIPAQKDRLRFQQAVRILAFELSGDEKLAPPEEEKKD